MALMHQETWVRFGTNGIGLSDHQNRYSSGVRIGSWVENDFGDKMQVRRSYNRNQRPGCTLLLMLVLGTSTARDMAKRRPY